jgi:uracil-DNA glycosylase family 4
MTKTERLRELYEKEEQLLGMEMPKWKGNPTARLAIICTASYPNFSDDQRAMIEILTAAGVENTSAFLTPAIKSPFGHMHKTPSRKDIDLYRPMLLEELDIVKPLVTVCLGGDAAKVLFGETKFDVSKNRTMAHDCPSLSCPVYVTYSPHFVSLVGRRSHVFRETVSDVHYAFCKANKLHPL